MAVSSSLSELHALSSQHRKVVERGSPCGCFYCGKFFSGYEVKRWVDQGQTALCPHCHIDAVLPEQSMTKPLSEEILEAMRNTYFAPPRKMLDEKAIERLLTPANPYESEAVAAVQREAIEELSQALLRLEEHRLRSDGRLARDLLLQLPWPFLVTCVIATVVMWPIGLLTWAVFGLLGGQHLTHVFRGLWAVARRDYAHPSLALGLRERRGNDYTPVNPNQLLYREAKDWSRAIPEFGIAWEDWHHRKPSEVPLRAVDLRHFIDVARDYSGGTPYVGSEPL